MSLPDWHDEPISRQRDRASFDCGELALNDFLRRHARQSHDKGAAKTFLAVSNLDGAILGYYTLCPASRSYARVPEIKLLLSPPPSHGQRRGKQQQRET